MTEQYHMRRMHGLCGGAILLLCVVALPPIGQRIVSDPDYHGRGSGLVRLWYTLPGQPWLGHLVTILTVLFAFYLFYKCLFGTPMLRIDDEGITTSYALRVHHIGWPDLTGIELVVESYGAGGLTLLRFHWTDWEFGTKRKADLNVGMMRLSLDDYSGLLDRIRTRAERAWMKRDALTPAAPLTVFSGFGRKGL